MDGSRLMMTDHAYSIFNFHNYTMRINVIYCKSTKYNENLMLTNSTNKKKLLY